MAWWNFPNDIFKDGDIFVVVNLEDYHIPANANPVETRKTSHNIISALRQLGSVGTIDFFAFYDDPKGKRIVYWVMLDSFIWNLQPGGRNMSEAMIGFLVSFPRIEPDEYEPEPPKQFDLEPQQAPIYVVIAKDRPSSELYRTLKCLKVRGTQIVLLNPVGDDYKFPSVKSVFEGGKILDGERLINISKYRDGFGEQDCYYTHNPLDFSRAIARDLYFFKK